MRRFEFAGKVCVVTGAASGIGAALALDLAGRHARLALIDRDEPGLRKVADAAREAGAEVETYTVDLSDHGDHLDLASGVEARFGPVDLLVNNAGVALGGLLHEVSMADIDWLLSINLRAVIAVTKAFLPQLMANPGAHVVNISSIFGIVAPPGQGAYVTSKFGVRGFTEVLRHELRAREVGVTVVHPGGIATNIANSARVGEFVPPKSEAEIEESRARTNKLLSLPPEKAAAQILSAVSRRRPRLVITPTAKFLDRFARLAPGSYWQILARLSSKAR